MTDPLQAGGLPAAPTAVPATTGTSATLREQSWRLALERAHLDQWPDTERTRDSAHRTDEDRLASAKPTALTPEAAISDRGMPSVATSASSARHEPFKAVGSPQSRKNALDDVATFAMRQSASRNAEARQDSAPVAGSSDSVPPSASAPPQYTSVAFGGEAMQPGGAGRDGARPSTSELPRVDALKPRIAPTGSSILEQGQDGDKEVGSTRTAADVRHPHTLPPPAPTLTQRAPSPATHATMVHTTLPTAALVAESPASSAASLYEAHDTPSVSGHLAGTGGSKADATQPAGQTAFSAAGTLVPAGRQHIFFEHTTDGVVAWVRDTSLVSPAHPHATRPALLVTALVATLRREAWLQGVVLKEVRLNGHPALDASADSPLTDLVTIPTPLRNPHGH